MRFKTLTKNISILLAMFSMAFVKPLVANARAKVDTMSLVEMFYQDSDEVKCDEKGQTVYDKIFITE